VIGDVYYCVLFYLLYLYRCVFFHQCFIAARAPCAVIESMVAVAVVGTDQFSQTPLRVYRSRALSALVVVRGDASAHQKKSTRIAGGVKIKASASGGEQSDR